MNPITERAKTETAADIIQDNTLESLLDSEYGIQVSPSTDVRETIWFRKFIEPYNRGNTEQALSILGEAFKSDPEEGLIWFWYGHIQDEVYRDHKKALQYYLTGARLCDKGKAYLLEKAAEQLLLECHDVANSIKFFFLTIQSAHADEKSDKAYVTEERAYQFLQIILYEHYFEDLSRLLVPKIISMKTQLSDEYRLKIRKSIEDSPYDQRTKNIIYKMYPILLDTNKPSQLTSDVVFYREIKKLTESGRIATYQIYKAELARSAMDFLKNNPVDRDTLVIIVETPEGNFHRDNRGVHQEPE